MKKRYVIATLIGVVMGLGLIGLLAYAGGYTWQDTGWDIPYAHNARAEVLQNQALLLRACHILLQDGLCIMAIPILGCLAFAKFMPSEKAGIHSPFARRTVWIYVGLSFVLFCLGFLHLSSSDIRAVHDWPFDGWQIPTLLFYFFLAICALSLVGILPGLAMIGALLLEWNDNCKDIPDTLVRENEQRLAVQSIAQKQGVVCSSNLSDTDTINVSQRHTFEEVR